MEEWLSQLIGTTVYAVITVVGTIATCAIWLSRFVRKVEALEKEVAELKQSRDASREGAEEEHEKYLEAIGAISHALDEHEKKDDHRFEEIAKKLEPLATIAATVDLIRQFNEKSFAELSERIKNHQASNAEHVSRLQGEVAEQGKELAGMTALSRFEAAKRPRRSGS